VLCGPLKIVHVPGHILEDKDDLATHFLRSFEAGSLLCISQMGVEIRVKHKASAPMHLKSYQIDGKLLRAGAANFSASGLKRQDNDLIVIESPGAATSFKRNFEARYASGEALTAGTRR
jgi:phosphatidylserine/phosphatidylglycerophosphate/cardiolipin synthase-like enzyme